MNGLKYRSGEYINVGDRVCYRNDQGVVEFVVEGPTGDPAMDWYVDQFSGGVMVVSPSFGRVFVPSDEAWEDLELVSKHTEEGH